MPKTQDRSSAKLLLAGASLGLAAAYLFDPAAGRRRRARLRDKSVHFSRLGIQHAARTARDLNHRMRGLVWELRRDLRADIEVDDITLLQRVRSQMGHAVHFPRAVEIEAHRGAI